MQNIEGIPARWALQASRIVCVPENCRGFSALGGVGREREYFIVYFQSNPPVPYTKFSTSTGYQPCSFGPAAGRSGARFVPVLVPTSSKNNNKKQGPRHRIVLPDILKG